MIVVVIMIITATQMARKAAGCRSRNARFSS
jgi:hypothetical protein